jgi:hypothetical protein
MKRLFASAWLGAWLADLLPDGVFFLGRKTPWYRRGWMANATWLAPALIAPFALFLLWKGGARLMRARTTEKG